MAKPKKSAAGRKEGGIDIPAETRGISPAAAIIKRFNIDEPTDHGFIRHECQVVFWKGITLSMRVNKSIEYRELKAKKRK